MNYEERVKQFRREIEKIAKNQLGSSLSSNDSKLPWWKTLPSNLPDPIIVKTPKVFSKLDFLNWKNWYQPPAAVVYSSTITEIGKSAEKAIVKLLKAIYGDDLPIFLLGSFYPHKFFELQNNLYFSPGLACVLYNGEPRLLQLQHLYSIAIEENHTDQTMYDYVVLDYSETQGDQNQVYKRDPSSDTIKLSNENLSRWLTGDIHAIRLDSKEKKDEIKQENRVLLAIVTVESGSKVFSSSDIEDFTKYKETKVNIPSINSENLFSQNISTPALDSDKITTKNIETSNINTTTINNKPTQETRVVYTYKTYIYDAITDERIGAYIPLEDASRIRALQISVAQSYVIHFENYNIVSLSFIVKSKSSNDGRIRQLDFISPDQVKVIVTYNPSNLPADRWFVTPDEDINFETEKTYFSVVLIPV